MSKRIAPVSVVLTTYNRASLLRETLESILKQSYGDFELIISDDCSTDNTESICREYSQRDPRIQYYRNENNLDMPGNLIAGLNRTNGMYIANLHDGDVFRQDLLEKWTTALDVYPSAAFVFNYYEQLDAAGRPTGCIHKKYDDELIQGERLIRDIIQQASSPVWGTVMARRSAYDVVGDFDPRFGFISDVDMWMRLAAKFDVACVLEPLISIRPRESDHQMHELKWRAAAWNEDLLCTNIARFYGGVPSECGKMRRDFFWNWDKTVFRWILSDIIHARWNDFRKALEFMAQSKSPRLSKLGTMMAAVRG